MTAPITPNDPSGDNDFCQLTGAFDRPIAPSPRFAEALKQRVQEEETTMQQVRTTPTRPVSHRTARATAQPLSRRKLLDIAIAAAVIAGMLGGTFWYASTRIGGDDTNDTKATHYAAQPLSSESTPEPAAVLTSDPGNVLNYPAGFDTSVEHQAVTLYESPPMPFFAAHASDTLVVSGNLPNDDDPDSQGLVAIDLRSRRSLWSVDLAFWGAYTIAGNRVVGVFEQPGDGNYYGMTSISLATGDVIWTGDPLVTYGGADPNFALPPGSAITPIVFNDAVYYADPAGTITALNAKDGKLLWSLPLEQPIGLAGPQSAISIAGEGAFLYAVDGENSIRKIDRYSGEVVDRFDMSDRDPVEHDIELHVADEVLVAVAHSKDVGGTWAFVDTLSTTTGERLWSHRVGSAGPLITIAGNDIVIPHLVEPGEVENVTTGVTEPGLFVEFFDAATGDTTSRYGPSSARLAIVSSSGSVVCINEGTAVVCIDTASDDRALVPLPYAPGEDSFTPLLFWNEIAIVLDMHDGVTLLQPTDAQPQQAMMFPGDPGHTSAWAEPFDISGGLDARELDGYPMYGASGTIVGDILIAENKHLAHDDPPTFSGTGIYAQDLTTGEILWRNTDQVHQRYTADDSGVYILPQPTTDIQRLIALDLTTGEERWRSDPLSTFSSIPDADGVLHAGTPIAIDGTVYLPMLDGVVLAFNGATGEIVWTYEGMSLNIENGDATIAGDENRIYTVAPDNVITVLDRETGALEHEFVLEDLPPSEYSLWPHAQADRLIIEARAKGDHEPSGMLVAVDPVSGDELWRQDTGVMVSNVVITPDRVGIVHAAFDDPWVIERIFTDSPPDGTLAFSLFDLETGEPIEAPEDVLTQVDGVWSAALAASGDTICLGYTTVTCFDPEGNVVMVDGYETPHITTIGQELLFWDRRLVILNPLVTNHLAAPATPVSATPVATPVAATPIATPIATPVGTP